MAGNLYLANSEWNNRPLDERFWTLEDLHAATSEIKRNAVRSKVRVTDLEVVPDESGTRLMLQGKEKIPARLAHYAFGQLSARVGAPADFLRKLPAEFAARDLNHCIQTTYTDDDQASLLMHRNGELVARALNGVDYGVIWNADISERVLDMARVFGWKVPPARPNKSDPRARVATEADCMKNNGVGSGIQIKPGDMIAPAGLYASDHDLFILMVNENRVIQDGKNELIRGVIVRNSEVGAGACEFLSFYLASVCGNHILWDVSDITSLKIIHRKNAAIKFDREFYGQLQRYNDASDYNDRSKIERAKTYLLGDNKEAVLDKLFGKKVLGKKALETAYDYAIEQADIHASGFSPNSAWGMVQGITRLSQDSKYTADRFSVDSAASKVLDMAF